MRPRPGNSAGAFCWHNWHATMPIAPTTITINGSTYAVSELSTAARETLRKVEAAQRRIDQLQRDLEMFTLARQSYTRELMGQLPAPKSAAVTVN